MIVRVSIYILTDMASRNNRVFNAIIIFIMHVIYFSLNLNLKVHFNLHMDSMHNLESVARK